MNRPHVTIHNMLSADGRLDHFAGDVGLYYEVVGGLPHDAVLSSSATFVAGAASNGIELNGEDPIPLDGARPPAGPADAPLLVVVDSGGRVARFDWLASVPYWRGVLVACSGSTPAAHLALLERHAIPHVVVGGDRVDLAGLLALLSERYDVTRVRVDSGGTLNGALLRAGLVDDVSLLLAPYAVGGRSPAGLFVADDLADAEPVRLELTGVERLRGDTVWLRYSVAAG
jgi:2,5-diamino-6-(ribosylamino)-4(3H)-pyrimidinone 5'-phosphate reductase